MSSEGPKMVERSYGLAENGLKCSENQEISGDPRWPPAMKFHQHDRHDVLLLPVRTCTLMVAGIDSFG